MPKPRIHFIGACGRAIGPLALALQRRGWNISASDGAMFPPMDRILREAGLAIHPKYAARHLPPETDFVVAGAGVAENNPELAAARKRGIPVRSMAQFLGGHLLTKGRRIVVAGTNGKTTTTAMLAHILEQCGRKPDYLIGGMCAHFPLSARFAGSGLTVLEGDEYPAAPNDPRPKFLHYRPDILLLTNIVFDHAEVYPNLEAILQHFAAAVAAMPRRGCIVAAQNCPQVRRVCGASRVPVHWVGEAAGAEYRITRLRPVRSGTAFVLCGQRFDLRIPGKMNALNAAMAAVAAAEEGVSLAEAAAALTTFRGVAGRLEILVDSPHGSLLTDESYHPAALRENIAALRWRHPRRRLVVALQPRYTGGRNGFQMAELPEVLAAADCVVVSRPFDLMEFPAGKFSSRALAARLRRRGVEVHVVSKARRFPEFLPRILRRGDVLLCSLPAGAECITGPLAAALRRLAPPR